MIRFDSLARKILKIPNPSSIYPPASSVEITKFRFWMWRPNPARCVLAVYSTRFESEIRHSAGIACRIFKYEAIVGVPVVIRDGGGSRVGSNPRPVKNEIMKTCFRVLFSKLKAPLKGLLDQIPDPPLSSFEKCHLT